VIAEGLSIPHEWGRKAPFCWPPETVDAQFLEDEPWHFLRRMSDGLFGGHSANCAAAIASNTIFCLTRGAHSAAPFFLVIMALRPSQIQPMTREYGTFSRTGSSTIATAFSGPVSAPTSTSPICAKAGSNGSTNTGPVKLQCWMRPASVRNLSSWLGFWRPDGSRRR
jgi:hypothetical protein